MGTTNRVWPGPGASVKKRPSRKIPFRATLLMTYFDEEGRACNSIQWRRKYLDPNYAFLKKDYTGSINNFVVTTSWVGVALSCEEVPKIFITVVSKLGGDGKEETVASRWSATSREALQHHEEMRRKFAKR